MAYENIVAVFETVAKAEAAIDALRKSGVEESDIDIHTAADRAAATDAESIWKSALGASAADSEIFDRLIAKGFAVVTVAALFEKSDDVVTILANQSPVDLSESLETYDSNKPEPTEIVPHTAVRRFPR